MNPSRSQRRLAAPIIFFFSVLLTSCSILPGNQGIEATIDSDASIAELQQLLADPGNDPSARAVIVEQLIQAYRNHDRDSDVVRLLNEHTTSAPDDPYNAYYLTLVGDQLHRSGKPTPAQLYWYRAVYRYPDVETRGKSVHYRALKSLIDTTNDPARRLQFYNTMQSRFAGKTDPGLQHYYMAKDYERIGNFDAAFEEYRNFTDYPDTRIPGQPNAHQNVIELLRFKDSARDWTFKNLDDLVYAIKVGINTRSSWRLNRVRAKVNFFAMSWKQDSADPNAVANFDIGLFLDKNRVRYAAELEPDSNSRQAYLWTAGWEVRIPTWYLYFRRIEFPADPDIHGNWEWAGIYFGERL